MTSVEKPLKFQGAPELGYMTREQLTEYAISLSDNTSKESARKSLATRSIIAITRLALLRDGIIDLSPLTRSLDERKALRQRAIEKHIEEHGLDPLDIDLHLVDVNADITDPAELYIRDLEQVPQVNLDTLKYVFDLRGSGIPYIGERAQALINGYIEVRRERLYDDNSEWYETAFVTGQQ